jgi:diguanylate cyclase (GGDEF)-like protein/PAS domain S-box-containing protein
MPNKSREHAFQKICGSDDLFNSFPDGIIVFAQNGTVRDANPAACAMYGYTRSRMTKLSAADILFGKGMFLFEQFKSELSSKVMYQNETVDHDSLGAIFNVEVRGVACGQGRTLRYFVFIRDITERKKVQETLEYMAHYDILTGLPNRVYFYNRFAHAIAYAKRDMSKIALLFLDIDGFKEVNDAHGHNIGDMVLQGVSERLQQCVRESDIVSRIGGDELAVVLTQLASRDDAEKAGAKIIESISKPFTFEDIVCTIGVSIGIVIYPDDGKETEILLKKADIAMYQVKESGKNNLRFYTPAV